MTVNTDTYHITVGIFNFISQFNQLIKYRAVQARFKSAFQPDIGRRFTGFRIMFNA